ncbi:MAG: hypothetical protein HC906_12585 [Bacteroidales bacterium]|nr:hypothetical protein [Bacteroidales bacterium]
MDKATRNIEKYQNISSQSNSLCNNNCNSLYLDKQKGELYIATIDGLDILNIKTKEFKHISKLFNFTTRHFLDIQQDEKKNLWISANNGIFRFNPVSGKINMYDKNDGFILNALYSFRMPDGEFFFGGPDGTNVFYPREIINNTRIPQVVITHFKLFDQLVDYRKGKILTYPISQTSEIFFKP